MNGLAIAVAALALVVTGCSTHEPRFESGAPPPPPSLVLSPHYLDVTVKLVNAPTRRLGALPPDALAPLTSAASLSFTASGSPLMRDRIRTYADALLRARVETGGVTGFFSRESPNQPDPGMTAIAGVALLDAYSTTHDRRYAQAAKEAAGAITSPQLGWTASGAGFAVRDPNATGRLSVSLTARAYLLLARATKELGAPTRTAAAAAFRVLDHAQVAVGRWYAFVGNHRIPMDLSQWASTLDSLRPVSLSRARLIAAGGILGMSQAVFDPGGQIRANSLTRHDPVGLALAFDALAEDAPDGLASRVFAPPLDWVRGNGTVDLAASTDATAQAYFALAFARQQLQLTNLSH